MHPEADERLAGQAFGLGDLSFVVREDEVAAPAMYGEGFTEVLHTHRRALDVPARPALAPGRRPRRLAVFLRLPEDEVKRVPLQRVGREVAALVRQLQLRDIRKTAELSEAGAVLDIEVNVASGCVGAAFCD